MIAYAVAMQLLLQLLSLLALTGFFLFGRKQLTVINDGVILRIVFIANAQLYV